MLQGSLLRMLHVLLVEQAQGRVSQGHEEVILLIEAVGIAGEGVLEQLQLVIGRVRGRNAALVELGLHI